jgi:hypothetical protein
MDSRTVVAGVQLATGAVGISAGYGSWRAGRRPGSALMFFGAMSIALAVSTLTTGWVHYIAWTVVGVGGVFVTKQLFTTRDRVGLWIGLLTVSFILAISVTELRLDDLSGLEKTAFALVALVAATLAITMVVRLVQPTMKPAARV